MVAPTWMVGTGSFAARAAIALCQAFRSPKK